MDSTSSSVDILQSITPLEIPRPKCHGMQFVPTRGRYGFYRVSDDLNAFLGNSAFDRARKEGGGVGNFKS